ncbi:Cys-tRNA(Pro) deacylase [Anaerobium acetethylicum]|uniref:Cys-tRNA(Pro)/Cys-tRNA(Cys) deacylase n=1 Tax=Anaerobium acetethylicum TaxID=1619234 RepID=A0A1D3TV99_9FIRM|nr:Cys-tRNA(Pro) deacylase [Anaerobium acetethylicum]SCP98043.1 Cys-tRNA(Pro)/Cys-tRNA(Cys) deacylase [Anaerobium acetethylicum]
MAKQKEIKTNAMRILDKLKIAYTHQSYDCDEFIDGIETADKLGFPHELVYKTLVTVGNSREYFVFVIPIAEELDMKKAARAAGEKSVAMIPVKDITSITGYMRGGCTAIGMKKQYRTLISNTAESLENIYISAGKIGVQMKIRPENFIKAANASYGDIIVR